MAGPVEEADLIELTAEIVAAYVSNNEIQVGGLAALIGAVHGALNRTSTGGAEPQSASPTPAVSVRQSVRPDYIVCLEDGERFKSLKRHLRTYHDMTPDQYREKWGLPKDYSMVAPNYAQTRSDLARQIGLGRKRARP